MDWPEWDELMRRALEVVESTVAALPEDLRIRTRDVVVTCEPEPGPEILAEGWPEDLLGLFTGDPYAVGDRGPIPPRIHLFLDNLWGYADGEDGVFRDEVRVTYLHELGHYLGLDEEDLEARGLL